MQTGKLVLVLAALAATTAAVADTGDSRAVQPPESDAAIAVPATPAATEEAATPGETASAESSADAPPADAASTTPAAETDATPAAHDADPAPAAAGDGSKPITVKMATVEPPADFKIPAGYRPVKRGLDTVYCTTVTPTGSRMPKTYCMSRAQVEERQRQAEIARRDVAQKTGSCDGGGCGAN